MHSRKTNLILLTGALLLGAFILLLERRGGGDSRQMQHTKTVFAVYPDSIEQLLLERDGVQMECLRTANGWRLTRPAHAALNSGMVDQMVSGMARVERGELLTAETLRQRNLTPSDYGFDAPRARITFKNSRGTFTWLIGRDAPVGKNLYVMMEGEEDIISAPQTLLHLIPQDPSWIRDRTLIAGEIAAVRGLDLRRPAGFLQLRQQEGSGWRMQQPHAGRADLPWRRVSPGAHQQKIAGPGHGGRRIEPTQRFFDRAGAAAGPRRHIQCAQRFSQPGCRARALPRQVPPFTAVGLPER